MQSQRTTFFNVESNALLYMQIPWIYHSELQLKRLQDIFVGARAISLSWNGTPAGVMLGHVDCMDVQEVASVHPGLSNMVSDDLLDFVHKDVTESNWQKIV